MMCWPVSKCIHPTGKAHGTAAHRYCANLVDFLIAHISNGRLLTPSASLLLKDEKMGMAFFSTMTASSH
jgi:hypothetical protein